MRKNCRTQNMRPVRNFELDGQQTYTVVNTSVQYSPAGFHALQNLIHIHAWQIQTKNMWWWPPTSGWTNMILHYQNKMAETVTAKYIWIVVHVHAVSMFSDVLAVTSYIYIIMVEFMFIIGRKNAQNAIQYIFAWLCITFRKPPQKIRLWNMCRCKMNHSFEIGT